jgi:hypothetical protein
MRLRRAAPLARALVLALRPIILLLPPYLYDRLSLRRGGPVSLPRPAREEALDVGAVSTTQALHEVGRVREQATGLDRVNHPGRVDDRGLLRGAPSELLLDELTHFRMREMG